MQLFGMYYLGIMDKPDLEWYTAILDECKSLDINDFLHNVSLYVVTWPQHAASSNVSQSARHSTVPPCCIVESNIFGSTERACKRSFDTWEHIPSLDILYGEDIWGFNQFGTMQGEVTRSDFITEPGAFIVAGRVPISLSRGYQSQDPI